MPKVTLEFNLPEEREEFAIVSKADAMHSALWELMHGKMRSMLKHGYVDMMPEEIKTEEQREAFMLGMEFARDYMWKVLEENDVDLG